MTAPDSPHLLTHSSMATYRLCKGRWYWSSVLGIRPVLTAIALIFGTRLHTFLEAWFLHGWDVAAATLTEEELADLDPYDRAMLRAMCLAYHARWAGERHRWRVLHVEVKFRAPIVNPQTGRRSRNYDQGGKIDLILLNLETSEVWVVEHKSSGADLGPSSTYWSRLRLDPQLSIYVNGARSLGLDPKGVIYDVVGKPDRSPLKATPESKRKYTQGKGCKLCGGKAGVQGDGMRRINGIAHGPCPACDEGWMRGEGPRLHADQREHDEAPGAFGARCFADLMNHDRALIHRREVARLDEAMLGHEYDVWQTAKDANAVRLRAEEGHRPSRNPDACFAFYRTCEFFDVCTGVASIDDPERFTRRGAHPELADDRVHLPVITDAIF